MKKASKIIIASGVIVALGMMSNILNINAMRKGILSVVQTGRPKNEETYSQTANARYRRQKTAEYLGDYDFRLGQAVRLFPDEKWTKGELKFFLKTRCDAERLLDRQGITNKSVRFEHKSTMYKFIDENIGYFMDRLRISTIMDRLISEDRHLRSEDLTLVVNRIKEELHDEACVAEIMSYEDKWRYIESNFRQSHKILFEEGFKPEEQRIRIRAAYSQTANAQQIRQKKAEYLGDYNFKMGQAVRLFPNEKWTKDELRFFLKTRCDAEGLLDRQGIEHKWVRFENKRTMYKFIDENIEYFSGQLRAPSIMKDLIERGIHMSSDGLTTAVNRIKRELNETDFVTPVCVDAEKWRYLESHYELAHRIFF